MMHLYLALTAAVAADASHSIAARTVHYGEKDVAPIRAKVRFTTMIVLPKREQILDFTCGDKEFWIVNGNQNFAYVKPAKTGSATNLNLVTAAGNVYSFVLTEVGEGAEHDLKVFIEPRDEAMTIALNDRPRFVAADQVDDFRLQAEMARAAAKETRLAAETNADREISRFRHEYPASLKFAYRFEAAKKPFDVSAIYHDGRFTYIRADPEETPALYELKDGKPNLVQFEFRQGLYVVAKVLDAGYLSIGKQSLPFRRREVGDE